MYCSGMAKVHTHGEGPQKRGAPGICRFCHGVNPALVTNTCPTVFFAIIFFSLGSWGFPHNIHPGFLSGGKGDLSPPSQKKVGKIPPPLSYS